VLELFVKMQKARFAEKCYFGFFKNPSRVAFFRDVARNFLDDGFLNFNCLEIHGELAAAQFALELLGTRCFECQFQDIEAGEIHCPECGRDFPVREGMPRLLPDQLRDSNLAPGDKGWRIKWQQMRQRDREAAIFESQFLPYQNRLDGTICMDALELDVSDRLLDAGTGVGRLLEFAFGRCSEVVAVDFSERSLMKLRHRARDRGAPVHLVVADVEHLPFRDAVFDKTLSFGILEHLPDAESCRATIEETKRTLKADGSAVFTAYNFSPLRRFLARIFCVAYEQDGWHDEIYFHRSSAVEFGKLMRAVSAEVDPLRGLRNIPKAIAAPLEPVMRPLDRLIGRLGVSRLTGYYLLAKLRIARTGTAKYGDRAPRNQAEY
jgi:ubiquinone/menaquinone biosynthesis C-methylase UbiE/uncharacterized protein YbaR (Trm112 family)